MGTFITLEGIDGCGKSTQSVLLSRWLEDYTGRETVRTYEPGGWSGGNALREMVLSMDLYAKSELLLFMADRSEHIINIIAPALKADHNVLCERYNDSSIAYQSGGHRLKIDLVRRLIKAGNFLEPDITILYDIEPAKAVERLNARKRNDRFENEGLDMLKRVNIVYRRLAKSYPERIKLIKVDDMSVVDVFNKTTEIIKNSCVLFK